MLRFNFFTLLERMDEITKTSIQELVDRFASKMEPSVEMYVKLRNAGAIMINLSKVIEGKLIDSDFTEGQYKGVKVTRRSGSSKKVFTDQELDDLETEAKKIKARIKARKTYLEEIGEVEIIPNDNDVIAMTVTK